MNIKNPYKTPDHKAAVAVPHFAKRLAMTLLINIISYPLFMLVKIILSPIWMPIFHPLTTSDTLQG